ncbi:MAG: hypothetical protein PVG61_08630 [Dehalococcoidia bacterium]|jgi:hypothetical protein
MKLKNGQTDIALDGAEDCIRHILGDITIKDTAFHFVPPDALNI